MTLSCAPEELLGQLAGTVRLSAAYVPDHVRHIRPRLASVAARLGMQTTRSLVGQEELLCLLARPAGAETAELAKDMEQYLEGAPFLMLIPPPEAPDAAIVGAQALAAVHPRWLARGLETDAGAVLVAPPERLLEAPSLAGDWRGLAAQAESGAATGDRLINLLRSAGEDDAELLAALEQRIHAAESQLAAARMERERMGAELVRVRATERREVDRLRLELLEERAWVSEQALRIAASTSWRLGHRLTRVARRLALKSDRGTNLPEQIAKRLEQAPFR